MSASEPPTSEGDVPVEARPIIQLEEAVINRIAAGEVVVRPANALKELLENSIDAGSTNIAVSLKNGGMKMLKIDDNGHGIRFDDLPIVCERFTTSKLRNYDDLKSIGTFGFRGEALASISHCAHVTITTMTKGASCAHIAQYTDSIMQGPPRPCAGTVGTTIVFEDLFYNMVTRQQALAKHSIETTKILEVMQRYAIHYPTISMTCRKDKNSIAELHTPGGAETTTQQVIGVVFGQSLSRELIPFECHSSIPKFSCTGFVSNPNWTSKSTSMILFINHRLVDCSTLKRALEAAYAEVLPRGQHPWIYLALELDPATIDVNVHPTKMEVQFLDEQLVIQRLQEGLADTLQSHRNARTFQTQVPIIASLGITKDGQQKDNEDAAPERQIVDLGQTEKARVDLIPTRVRTDPKQQSLQTVWRTGVDAISDGSTGVNADLDAERTQAFNDAQDLESICNLKNMISLAADDELTSLLNKAVYVGAVDREVALLQCGSKLNMVNLALLAKEGAYQRLLRSFGATARLTLAEPIPLNDVLRLGILDPGSGYDPAKQTDFDVEAQVAEFTELLRFKAEMLGEYVSLIIEEDKLVAIPNALGAKSSAGLSFEELPLSLVRLCVDVDWSQEQSCFEQICRILADLSAECMLPPAEDVETAGEELDNAISATEPLPPTQADSSEEVSAPVAKRQKTANSNLEEMKWLFEALRADRGLRWPGELLKSGAVMELVRLEQLYRIFERC